jgi:hypothetical protein
MNDELGRFRIEYHPRVWPEMLGDTTKALVSKTNKQTDLRERDKERKRRIRDN